MQPFQEPLLRRLKGYISLNSSATIVQNEFKNYWTTLGSTIKSHHLHKLGSSASAKCS